MSSPIDVQAVVAAVGGDDPTGPDLRAGDDADFTALRERVEEAQRRRRSLERGDPSDAPDWATVAAKSAELLAKKTKDIQVLSWMIESATRAYGLEGLACALEAAAGVVDQFLPQMHPRPEPGDDEFRLRPLIGLDNNGTGTLIQLIQQQPIISGPGSNGTSSASFNILHQQQATTIEKMEPDKKAERVRDGAVSLDAIARAAARMTPAQVVATAAVLDRAVKATEALSQGLLRHCGADAPPTSAILESLLACKSMLATYTKDKQAMAAASSGADEGNGSASGSSGGGGRGSISIGSVPMEREAVLGAIGRLVAALDALEPQNLAVPALQQAIAWARMDRVALLTDLLGNTPADTAREKLFRLIGLKAPAEEQRSE